MKRNAVILMVLLFTVTLFASDVVFARKRVKVVKPKQKKVVVVKPRPVRKPAAIVKLPAKHAKIVVKDRAFFHHAGVWYKHGPKGYTVVRAPRGAHLKVIPVGHRIVFVGGITYYHYYGTYYRHDIETEEYYVVDAPVDQPGADVLTMVDGEVLEGQYLSGNGETIEFVSDGETYEIEIADIISIEFAPPTE